MVGKKPSANGHVQYPIRITPSLYIVLITIIIIHIYIYTCVLSHFIPWWCCFLGVFLGCRGVEKGRRRTGGSLQHSGGTAPGLRSALRKGLAGGIKGYDGLWMFLFLGRIHIYEYLLIYIWIFIYIYIWVYIYILYIFMYIYIYMCVYYIDINP